MVNGQYDISQQRIEVNHVVRLWRETQDHHHQLLRWEDEDVLTIVPVAIEHILRHIRELAITVQPEKRAIVVTTVSSRGARIVNPSLRQDPLVINAAVIEVHLSEACEIHGCGVDVR